jgi:hypothetical protein
MGFLFGWASGFAGERVNGLAAVPDGFNASLDFG